MTEIDADEEKTLSYRHVPDSGADAPTLGYADTGSSGRSTLLLLHSLGADHRMWRPQIRELRAHWRILAADTRGHGGSAWCAPLSVEQWVEDIDRLLDHAGVDDVHIAGISMGGVQALAYAAHRPDRVHALVIADSFAELDDAVAQRKIADFTTKGRERGMPSFADHYVATTFTTDPPVPEAALVRTAIAAVPFEAFEHSTRTCFETRLAALLPRITAPALVLWGERDEKTPLWLSEQIARDLPNAELLRIPGAGHLANLENPTAFSLAMRSFLMSQTR